MRIVVVLTLATLAFAQSNLPAPATKKIDFEKDVQPLLEQKCYSCHGDRVQQAGLRLDRRQAAMRGGDYGPVIIAGDSAASKLIKRVVNGDGGLQMPPTGALSEEEIGILRAWIDQGADYRISVIDEAPAKPVDPKLRDLISAVRNRDGKTFERLLALSPDLVKAQDAEGATLLHRAAGFGTIGSMQLLIDKGADVNAGNKRKSTPLHWALHDEAKVRLLLKNGANASAKTVEGRTPIYQAAMLGNPVPVLRALLEAGADPNATTLNGVTPLTTVARSSLDGLKFLIDKGANVNAKTAAGVTALMAASGAGDAEAVRILLAKGADPNAKTKKNETALGEAATSGSVETVRLLLDAGAEVNVADTRGYTALLYAAGADAYSANIVSMLLAKGASLDAKGDGETAQMLAAKRGDTEVARLLGVPEQDRTRGTLARIADTNRRERPLADSVGAALSLLATQSHNFIRIGGCNSCHAQDLSSIAAAMARERGLPAPKTIEQLPPNMHAFNPSRTMDLFGFGAASYGWEMFDYGANRVPRDEYTDAVVRVMKAQQSPEGNWRFGESTRRPPMSAGEYQAAALAIYTLKTYGPPAEQADTDRVIAKAVAWLTASNPRTTQDRAFHLLGLAWGGAKADVVAASARQLAALQRGDGGWSQLPTLGSDAYATGQALYALGAGAKMPATNAVFARGAKYLRQTQADDGSWHVKTRSIWIQPYFESGFPYAHDQWISAAGTSWAVMALSLTSERPQLARTVR